MFIRKFDIGSIVCDKQTGIVGKVKQVDEQNAEFTFLVEFDDGTKKWCSGSNLQLCFKGYRATVYINKSRKTVGAKVHTKYGAYNVREAKDTHELYKNLIHFVNNFKEEFFSQKFKDDKE